MSDLFFDRVHLDQLPPPVPDEDSQPYWSGLARGVLVFQRCGQCSRSWFPPMPRCPHCGSDSAVFEESSGLGTIYTFTVTEYVFHPAFADRVPYAIVTVDLDEGPRVHVPLRGYDPAVGVTIGARVRLDVEHVGGMDLPVATAEP